MQKIFQILIPEIGKYRLIIKLFHYLPQGIKFNTSFYVKFHKKNSIKTIDNYSIIARKFNLNFFLHLIKLFDYSL